ncbi:DUF1036 domain-containing protein [Candidatus Uabimicrobium amorphum]|uniref:Uncharacterized protein n=1 Tax=Uabimicrobium amorphum TaxID=2596890 RepID=A0A5S9IRQ3_UABAM|nr:DUF1036 domain-containing protein [Candidatus Uabimicrobium amorphum]BBM86231.1 hypothetical protein UABAM_04617 [Candidatus Uabimicrobium amorphum]
MNKIVYIAIILSFTFTFADRIQANIDDDMLHLKIPQSFFTKELAAALNSEVAGFVLDGKKERLRVSNFRVFITNVSTNKSYYNHSFISRRSKKVLYVDFDYKYYRKALFWITDSGWIGTPIFFSVNDWEMDARCYGRYIDWSSNNAITRALSSLIQDIVEEEVETNINDEIQKLLKKYGDLRYLAKHYGGEALADTFGGKADYIKKYFESILDHTNLRAHIEDDGLVIKIKMGGRIYVENNSSKDIDIAIHYKDLTGQWKTECWWEIKARKGIYPAGLRTLNPYIYIYAISHDQSREWTGDDTHDYVKGRKLGFREMHASKDSDGDHVIQIE